MFDKLKIPCIKFKRSIDDDDDEDSDDDNGVVDDSDDGKWLCIRKIEVRRGEERREEKTFCLAAMFFSALLVLVGEFFSLAKQSLDRYKTFK